MPLALRLAGSLARHRVQRSSIARCAATRDPASPPPTRSLGGMYAVRLRRGSVYLSDADYVVDRKSLRLRGRRRELCVRLRRSAVVLDLGAHKGYFGAYAVSSGARAIVAYEPESANLAVLQRTARRLSRPCRLDDPRQLPCGATSGQAELHVMGASWGHALSPARRRSPKYEVGTRARRRRRARGRPRGGARRSRGGSRARREGQHRGSANARRSSERRASAWDGVDEVFVETHPWAAVRRRDLASHLEPAGLTRVESAPSGRASDASRRIALDPVDVAIPRELASTVRARARAERARVPLVAEDVPHGAPKPAASPGSTSRQFSPSTRP